MPLAYGYLNLAGRLQDPIMIMAQAPGIKPDLLVNSERHDLRATPAIDTRPCKRQKADTLPLSARWSVGNGVEPALCQLPSWLAGRTPPREAYPRMPPCFWGR